MNQKNILIWTVVIIATFFLLLFAYKLTNGSTKTDFSQINQVRENDHIRWRIDKDSKNFLIEYSDIQCPACKNFHELLKTFEASSSPDFAITQKITLIYRHYPLYQIHKNSSNAAYAAEAAALQDKFWEMLDVLYDKQSEWSSLSDPKNYFINQAKSLKLDMEKFQKDIDSKQVKDKVQTDLTEAESIGVNSTPTFFINGKQVKVRSIDEFKQLLLSL